jgi:alpha-galactosidase
VLRADADEHRINFVLTSAFLGRLCLSGDVDRLPEERWRQALDAVAMYAKVRHIIRDGFTDVIESTVRDYSAPEGWQIVRRVLGDEALLVVHTYAGGANPPVEKYMSGYREIVRFGSPLDGELRGAVLWLRREKEEPRET